MPSEETTQVDLGPGEYWSAGLLVTGIFVFVVLLGSVVVQYPYAIVESVGVVFGIIVVPYAVGRLSFWLWGLLR